MVIQMNLNQSQKENQNLLTKSNDKRNESTLNCHQNKQQFSNKRMKLEINNNNNNEERNGGLGVMTSSQLDDDFDDDLNDETIDEKCSQALELHLAQTNQFNSNSINNNFNNNVSDHMIIGIHFYFVFF
jgi:hypothetical protein